MAQLRKGMYPNKKYKLGPFGLYCGQMRGRKKKITHNSGWYNKAGAKLGWGDLSGVDFQRISRELKSGQLFIVLSEVSSYWRFVTFRGSVKRRTKVVSQKEKAPGVNYVVKNASYVIGQNKLYIVDRFGHLKVSTYRFRDLRFKVINCKDLKKLITKKS